MGWVKLEDRYRSHPKVAEAGESALALDVCGMCFCREQGTDGFIPDTSLHLVGPIRRPKLAAQALVRVGRWERDDVVGGYWIHDFTDYNPSDDVDRVAADERREKARKAARARWGKAARSNAPSNAQASTEQCSNDAPSNASPMPPSPPHPLVVTSSSEEPLGVDGVPPPAADDDDDERRTQAWALAETDLERREAERGPVAHRERWLEAAAQRRLDCDDLSALKPAVLVGPQPVGRAYEDWRPPWEDDA